MFVAHRSYVRNQLPRYKVTAQLFSRAWIYGVCIPKTTASEIMLNVYVACHRIEPRSSKIHDTRLVLDEKYNTHIIEHLMRKQQASTRDLTAR